MVCNIQEQNGLPKTTGASRDPVHPAPLVTAYKDYDALSLELGFPVMEAVDGQTLKLYQAMLKTFGSAWQPPLGKDGVSRTRSIVSTWNPQTYDSGVDAATIRKNLAFSKFFKRYLSAQEYEDSHNLVNQANEKYLKTMVEGHEWNDRIRNDEALKPLLNHMRHTIKLALGKFDLLKVYKKMKHGPNSTGTIAKSNAYKDVKDWCLTGTRSSLQQFHHYLRWNDIRRNELVEMSDEHRRFINGLDFDACNVVDYNETLQVPKEWDVLRTMNPENTVPAQIAQGTAAELEEALFKVGIDLESQPEVHRNLAKLGSLHPEALIATIDWSEASNRIWLAIFELTFEEEWVRWIINTCRSPKTMIGPFTFTSIIKSDGKQIDKDTFTLSDLDSYRKRVIAYGGEESWTEQSQIKMRKLKSGDTKVTTQVKVIIESPMIATMGNPITFPLQTLIFYAFLSACSDLAAMRLARDPRERGSDDMFVSCFGDDGILSVRAIPEVQTWAKSLGWIFNDHKSFYTGSFRESCGGDYYRGYEVRPVMLKRPPSTYGFQSEAKDQKRVLQSWGYIAANAVSTLVRRSGHNDVLIQQWLAEFHATFKMGSICLVPPYYPDGSGLRVKLQTSFPIYKASIVVGKVKLLDTEIPEIVDDLDEAVAKHAHLPVYNVFSKSYEFRAILNAPQARSVNEVHWYEAQALRFTSVDDDITLRNLCDYRCMVPSYKVYASRSQKSTLVYRGALSSPRERPKQAYYNKGFFDLSGLDRTSLDSDGKIPVKELRLLKKISTVPQWDWWIPASFINH